MKMTAFAGSRYWKVARLKGRDVRARIAAVNDGQYGKPDIVFEDGSILSANKTNVGELIRLFGEESEDWIGKEIELYVGEISFQGDPKESVLVREVETPARAAERDNGGATAERRAAAPTPAPKAERKPETTLADDTDDSIPF